MQIFDEIRARGVEDVLFISMDGVSGLEEGARSIFQDVVVQRCIVHLIRNSIKYIPSKDYKAYTAQLKKVYRAPSLKAAEAEFERFKQVWAILQIAIDDPYSLISSISVRFTPKLLSNAFNLRYFFFSLAYVSTACSFCADIMYSSKIIHGIFHYFFL